MNKTLDRYKGLELVKAESSRELESRRGYQGGSVHSVEFQPGIRIRLVNVNANVSITFWTHVLQESKYKYRQHLHVI